MSTVPECWHGDVCPWHKCGRCLFKPARLLQSGSCGEVPVEQQLRDLRGVLQRLAAAVMWRDGVQLEPLNKMVFYECEDTMAKDTVCAAAPQMLEEPVAPIPQFLKKKKKTEEG